MNARGTISRIYNQDHYTLLHTKYEALGLVASEKIFLCFFSNCKSRRANDPRDGAFFNPRGMVGRIYKEDHYTLRHTNYESSGPRGFEEEDFCYVFPVTPPGCGLYGSKGHGWQDL